MNILFLSELFYPHGGGRELATYLYAKLLSEAGFNVIVLTNQFPGEPEKSTTEGLTVYRAPLFKNIISKYFMLQRFDVLFSAFMRRLVGWASVIYVPGFWYSMIPLAKFYGKPVVTHLHDYISICPLATLYDFSQNTICHRRNVCSPSCIISQEKIARNSIEVLASAILNLTARHYLCHLIALSDAIVCVSHAQRRLMIKQAPFLRRKCLVIYNPLPKLVNVDIEGDDFGYFGGSSLIKGFHILCQALAFIKHKTIRVHSSPFSNLTDSLVKYLAELGILLYGKLGGELYEKVYRQIRGVIVPSISPEPLPYLVSEAILRGRVVAASRVGGIPEQVEGCRGVFLFDAGEYEQLAEVLESISGLDKETIVDLGSQNREAFVKRFKNESIMRDFVKLLANVSNEK